MARKERERRVFGVNHGAWGCGAWGCGARWLQDASSWGRSGTDQVSRFGPSGFLVTSPADEASGGCVTSGRGYGRFLTWANGHLVAVLMLLAMLANPLFGQPPADRSNSSSQPTLNCRTDVRDSQLLIRVSGFSPHAWALLVERMKGNEADQGTLQVFVDSDFADPSPLFGKVEVEEPSQALLFVPRFALKDGLRYRVGVDWGQGTVWSTLTLPEPPAKAPAQVTAVYPSDRRWPQNVLRVYVHFSAPMSRGAAYSHLELLDDQGQRVDAPFLELPQELWDPEQQRFSLLFDPGRIKRGLVPRQEQGPALLPGREYSLVIRKTWLDAHGKPMTADYRKSFIVEEPWERRVDINEWVWSYPDRTSGATLLKVQFDRSMNRGMALNSIRVLRNGTPVPGTIELSDHERHWSFQPQQPWQPGDYTIEIDPGLEDIAGNRLDRPFEVVPRGLNPSGSTTGRGARKSETPEPGPAVIVLPLHLD